MAEPADPPEPVREAVLYLRAKGILVSACADAPRRWRVDDARFDAADVLRMVERLRTAATPTDGQACGSALTSGGS